ncbi:MAG: hypothetical protein Q8858_12425 [Bacteroidota bacterium]|nr:hypothetical protein [Bacteroidota bacterium]
MKIEIIGPKTGLTSSLFSSVFLFVLFALLFIFSSKVLAQDDIEDETGGSRSSKDSSKTIVEKVKDFSGKDNFFSKLVRSFLVSEDEETKESRHRQVDKINKKYSGRIIRKINIRVLDVFGTSVDHPLDTAENWLQRAGNAVHLETKDWLIKDKLLFYEGSTLLPFDLQESERILRQSPYIYDARIVARGIKNNKDSVDVMVYVQDIWSITGGAAYHPGDKEGNLSFKDINFLGLGNEMTGGIKFDDHYNRGWDWDGSYTFNNIDRTYLTAKLYYLTDKDLRKYGLSINRDFFSPVINWAGGISLDWYKDRQLLLMDTLLLDGNVKFSQQDYWLGYAFDVKPFDPNTVNQNRFNVSGRIIHTTYLERPSYDTMGIYQNSTFYLGRLGFSLKKYYQDSYIFGLGKTEDIPLGSIAEFIYGIEKGSSFKRPYFGFKSGYSLYDENFGYLYAGLQMGAFRVDQNWLNGTSVFELLYFSKLLPIGGWMWRHYIGSRYSHSYDSQSHQEILDLNNEHGLRGFNDNLLKGNKKLTLNYETDYFVPIKFFGFKMALITFADLALLSPAENSLYQSKLYSGFGIGIRIRNEHLIFPTFQLMLGYYPNTVQPGGERFSLFKQNAIFYQFNQFQFSKPSPVQF